MKNICKAIVSLLLLFACLSACAQAPAAKPAATPAAAQPAPLRKNLLILFGYQSDFTPPATQGLQAEFDKASDLSLNQFSEYTDLNRFTGADYQKQLADLYAAKYKTYPPDLVILAGRAALAFWLAHRAEIAPDAPVVAFDLTPEDLKTIQSMPNSTGLGSTTDFNKSIDWILQARPSVKEIIFVHGAGPYDQQFFGYATSMQAHLAGRAQFSDWSSLSLAEMKQRAAGLSPSSVIIYAPMFQDAAGVNYYPTDALRQLASVSAVAVLSSFEQFIGTGAIGGYSYSLGKQAGQAAQIGLRILRGAAASSIPLNFDSGNQFIFDHPALQRYNIPLSSFPPDSIIQNRQYSFWETYQPQIIGAGLIFAFFLLLTISLALLNQRLISARRSLQQLNASLESQVRERTAAITSANAALTAEIVKHTQVEQALRESEARFRSYFDLPLIGIAITSPEKGWLQVNDSLCSMLGYTAEELAGMTWAELTHPDDKAADEALFEQVLAGAIDTYTLEKRFIRKDGSVIWTGLSVGCVRNPDGALNYLLALLQNITKRKLAEVALQDSENQISRLLEATDQGIYGIDLHGNCTFINRAATALLGYRSQECLGLNVHALIHHSHPDGSPYPIEACPILHANRSGVGVRVDSEVLWRKDGSAFPVEYTASPIVEKGEVRGLVVAFTDITLRKRMEKELAKSEKHYRFLAENMNDVVWILDPETMYFRYVSSSGERLLGYTAEEILKIPLGENLAPEIREAFLQRTRQRVADFRANPQPDVYYRNEARQVHKKGSFVYVEVVNHYYLNETSGEVEILGVSRDITERKRAEQALQEAHQQLEQRVAERTAELQAANLALEKAGRMKDEFFAAMSHELRTPLSGVLGLAQVLQMKSYGPLTEKQTSAVVNIEASGKRLLELINNILDYTQLETGLVEFDLQPCSLAEICQDCLRATHSQAAAKHQQSSLRIEPPTIILRADPSHLRQALNHLLSNAIKFTGDGGSFGIEVLGNVSEQQMRITIWDTGIGIMSEDFPRLFQPFLQLDARLARQFNGTGLGLALVKRLVELQGGSVQVQSVFGEGSRFSLSLPWHPPED